MADLQYDVCIIGGGLSGLVNAKLLAQRGLRVTLLESKDVLGGTLRASTRSDKVIGHDLGYVPATENARLALETLFSLLGQEVALTEETLPPLTYSKNQLHPFVGFGESAPPYIDELSYYLKDSRFVLNTSLTALTLDLSKNLDGIDVRYNSTVTQMEFKEKSVVAVRLDEGTSVRAKAFIFSADASQLLQLLPCDHYSTKDLQRLLKTTEWSTVSLDLVHNHVVTQSRALHLLVGTTKESLPCIGSFDATKDSNQTSHWLAFVPRDSEEDEAPAHALREIKRQLKRAYPTSLDGLTFEKISYDQFSHSSKALKLDAKSRWPGLENFWVSSSAISAERGVVGSVCQALLVTASIGAQLTSKSEFSPSADASL